MEGVGQIMNPGVVLSVAQAPIVEAPSMAVGVGSSMEGIQTGPQIPEVAERFDAPGPEEAGSRNLTAQKILDSAKDEGYDAVFEKLAQGDFEVKPENELVDGEPEGRPQVVGDEEEQPEEMEPRVQALENRVSSLLQENMRLRHDITVMKDLYVFTLEELLAFAILLRKRLEGKTEEDGGLLDVLFSLIGKLFQAMVEPEVITGEEANNKAA